MYGEDQRQAIRELADINEIELTTHSAYNIMGMMGKDERGNFSISNATLGRYEIERAVDFAADTAGGGSVVVHSGEFDRPLTDMVLDDETNRQNLSFDSDSGRLIFRKRHVEQHDANFVLLDDRTSQKLETVHKDRLVAYPVWLTAGADKEHGGGNRWGVDQDGKKAFIKDDDYVDYEGRKITGKNTYDPAKGRVPIYDKETGRFKIARRDFIYFTKEAQRYNEWLKKHWKTVPKFSKWSPEKFEKMWYYYKKYPEESFMHATLETNEGHSRGWALQYADRMMDNLKLIHQLTDAREFYADLKEKIPKSEQWKLLKRDGKFANITGGILHEETRDPVEWIDQMIREQRANLEFSRQASASQEQQAEDTAETKEHVVTPIKRLEKHGVRQYAWAGIRAWKKSKDPNNPITLAIENIFPEQFGGHPQELKWVIKKARDAMVSELTSPELSDGAVPKDKYDKDLFADAVNPNYVEGMSKEEATKLAKNHIKATLDTGHLNMWRKFYVEDPKKSLEDNDKEFKEWYLKQVEDLAKGGYIGNLHLTDNFGYQDDHIAPGQGNVPIKEVLGILRKYGYNKAITVEPGADASTDLSDFHGLMKTWRFLGSPIYGIGSQAGRAPQTWANVHYSYFGQNQPPQYIFGGYAPSNDWTLWSAVPLE